MTTTLHPTASRSGTASTAAAEGVAASGWLRSLVTGPLQAVRVVGVSGPACYLRVDAGPVVAVEARGGARLPNALALDPAGRGLAGIAVGAVGHIGDGALRVAGRAFAVRRWWDPRPRVGAVDPATIDVRARALPTAAVPEHRAYRLDGPLGRLREATVAADTDALATVVPDLVGRGPGSTPAGDDVLAGLVAALRVWAPPPQPAQQPHPQTVRTAAAFADAVMRHVTPLFDRTTALSATLLRCADDGAVVASAARVLRALAGLNPVAPAVATLARVGHTSGRDLLVGIGCAAALLTTEEDRA